MDRGKGNGNIIERITKAIRMKKIIIGVVPIAFLVVVLSIVLITTITLWERILPFFTTSSMVGETTIYDNTQFMLDAKLSVLGWTEEETFLFNELPRQKKIWVEDYKEYGINHYAGNPFLVIDDYQNNDLDLSKIVFTLQHKGAVNLNSYDVVYNSNPLLDNGVYANDYEGEALVFNRDTRDFYEKAGTRIGNTFFIYPGSRKMLGNLIAADIDFYPVEAIYQIDEECKPHIANEMAILSDWNIIGKMALKDDEAYENYLDAQFSGPYTDASYFAQAFTDGYDYCIGNKKETIEDEWEYLNICHDYWLLFEETGPILSSKRIGSTSEFETAIRMAVSPTSKLRIAELPFRENNKKTGKLEGCNYCSPGTKTFPSCPGTYKSGEYYIAVDVNRFADEDLYDRYIEKVYIPYVYPNTDASQVLFEMKQIEQTYKYYNGDGYMSLNSLSGSITGGTADIEGSDYTCNSNAMPNLATYPGHKGIDINGVPVGTNVYPLYEGEVVSVTNYNYNCYPQGNDVTGYTCGHCGGNGYGNMVKIKGKAADGNEYYAIYAHLNEINVSVGQHVTMDTTVGTVGNTGCSTGPHLHLELRKMDNSSIIYATQIYNNGAVQSTLCSRSIKENV